MHMQSLGCGFQNEATITASIQMPLDLTFYARRELPFHVQAHQMHGIPTAHIFPIRDGLILISTGCNRTWRKAVQIGTLWGSLYRSGDLCSLPSWMRGKRSGLRRPSLGLA